MISSIVEKHKVTFLKGKFIVDIEGDSRFTYSLDKDGRVWALTRSLSRKVSKVFIFFVLKHNSYTKMKMNAKIENINFAPISHGDGHYIALVGDD